MKEELFNELLESLHEGGAILRHEKTPSRKFTFQELDVQKIRSIFRLLKGSLLRCWALVWTL